MMKRKLDPKNTIHMASNDSILSPKSSKLNHVSKIKKLSNNTNNHKISTTPKVTINNKTPEKVNKSKKMDDSLSRKSTSDTESNMSFEPLNKNTNFTYENDILKDFIELSNPVSSTHQQNSVDQTLPLEHNPITDSQIIRIIDNNNEYDYQKLAENDNYPQITKGVENEVSKEQCENYLGNGELGSIINSQILEDNFKEKLTPSRKANYVHTLLSGRTSLDDSINILNKLSQSELNTQVSPVHSPVSSQNSIPENQNDKYYEVESIKEALDNEFVYTDTTVIDTTSTITNNETDHNDESNNVTPYREIEYDNSEVTKVDESVEFREAREEEDYSEMDSDVVEFNHEHDVEELISRYKTLYNNSFFNCSKTGTGKLRVVVRCRPSTCRNKAIQCERSCVKLFKPGNKNSVLKSQRPGIFEFNFDHIVMENESTEKLYTISCMDLIEKLFSGISVTIFAYGSTGSGKTYTIAGTESSVGLLQLMITDLFKSSQVIDKELYLSYYEVYNENVYDLLQENEINLHLQENESRVFVKGLTRVKISNYEDFRRLFEIGDKNRKVFSTNANRSSSRSHAILQIQTNLNTKLTIIDLAGSERMKITDNAGDRLKESSYINQSLLALINCINTLAKKSNSMSGSGGTGERVKYRDSKLTHLLKNSLTNNCFILMIAHVNPENKFYQDSYNTIKYALRAKDVEISQVITNSVSLVSYLKSGKEVIKKFSKELLFLVNLMKNNISENKLELIRKHISQSHLVGRPLHYIGQLSLESFNRQVIQGLIFKSNLISIATIDKCSKTHNPRILEAIKQSWIENLNKRLNSVKYQSKKSHSKLSKSVREVLEENKESEKPETSEDEFLDADVVLAKQSSSSVSPVLRPTNPVTSELPKNDEYSLNIEKAGDNSEKENPDTDISISDISDLDDEEPETDDLVIGMLDKVLNHSVTRPSSKKFGPPLWKLKLKYGIMQVCLLFII
uniref:Kinesin, putative n=1 Tax=Theileria annulata TaxID=5874 RepID=A0A3B0MZD6_THEAN